MRLALIGDLHGFWDARDNAYFERSDDDALLFTGDLPPMTGPAAFVIAERMAELRKPFAVIPGNHDCVTMAAFLGEVIHSGIPGWFSLSKMLERLDLLRDIFGDRLLGYSSLDLGAIRVVGARPFAMDARRLSFPVLLEAAYGVKTHTKSADRILSSLRGSSKPAVVLAHNGPAGFGNGPQDIFGVDFRAGGGDNGDSDLRDALDAYEGDVPLVVAGHMHHAVRRGGPGFRRYAVRMKKGLLVNAARVPRHEDGRGYYLRAEVISGKPTTLTEVFYDLYTMQSEEHPLGV